MVWNPNWINPFVSFHILFVVREQISLINKTYAMTNQAQTNITMTVVSDPLLNAFEVLLKRFLNSYFVCWSKTIVTMRNIVWTMSSWHLSVVTWILQPIIIRVCVLMKDKRHHEKCYWQDQRCCSWCVVMGLTGNCIVASISVIRRSGQSKKLI